MRSWYQNLQQPGASSQAQDASAARFTRNTSTVYKQTNVKMHPVYLVRLIWTIGLLFYFLSPFRLPFSFLNFHFHFCLLSVHPDITVPVDWRMKNKQVPPSLRSDLFSLCIKRITLITIIYHNVFTRQNSHF